MSRSIGMITLGVTAVAASSLLLAEDTPGPSGPERESAALVLVGTLLTLLSQLIGVMPPDPDHVKCKPMRLFAACAAALHDVDATAWKCVRILRTYAHTRVLPPRQTEDAIRHMNALGCILLS